MAALQFGTEISAAARSPNSPHGIHAELSRLVTTEAAELAPESRDGHSQRLQEFNAIRDVMFVILSMSSAPIFRLALSAQVSGGQHAMPVLL